MTTPCQTLPIGLAYKTTLPLPFILLLCFLLLWGSQIRSLSSFSGTLTWKKERKGTMQSEATLASYPEPLWLQAYMQSSKSRLGTIVSHSQTLTEVWLRETTCTTLPLSLSSYNTSPDLSSLALLLRHLATAIQQPCLLLLIFATAPRLKRPCTKQTSS